jgi:hypothetical protein
LTEYFTWQAAIGPLITSPDMGMDENFPSRSAPPFATVAQAFAGATQMLVLALSRK